MISHEVLNDESAIIKTGKELDNNNAHEMVEKITSLQNSHFKFIIMDFSEL